MASLKQKVYEIIVEPPKGYTLGERVTFGVLILIALNVLVGIFETVEYLGNTYYDFFYYET